MGKPQKVATLLGERQKIEREIEDIQNSCQHSTKSIKFIRERLDSTTMVIRWVCNICLLSIGYPSKEKIEDYLNNKHE
tara:strand:+ start:333 stop:566 length:234 start_codon:yes stop_codon:yes gene_type:complete